MGEIYTEKSWCFLILEALRTAGSFFCRNAPKGAREQREQELRLQADQNMIWYDPDLIEPLREFLVSVKWGKHFSSLESGKNPNDILQEVQQEIKQKGLRTAIMNALNCWDEERKKERKEKGLPEYQPAYVREQLEKQDLAQKGFCDLDAEGSAYRDYLGHIRAVNWMNGAKTAGATVNQEGEPIHWGVCNALRDAADAFIGEERKNIELFEERLHFADAEGNDAEHLEKTIESAVQRVDEIEKFRGALVDAQLRGDVEGLLNNRVRAWLLSGLQRFCDTRKWREDFIRSEKWRLENGLMPDEQLFLFQTYRLLRRLPEVVPDAETGKLAADGTRGRKVKLPPDVFERDIYPLLDKEFPSDGGNAGIKKRCGEIGKQYNVSESTIRRLFYDVRLKNQGNKSG